MAQTPTPDPQDFAQLMAAFQNWMQTQSQGEDGKPAPEPVPDASDTSAEQEVVFRKIVDKATEALNEADSFIAIVVTREQHEESELPILVPRAFNFYKSPEGGLLAEMQLSKLAAISHEEVILEAMENHIGEPDES